MKKVKLNITSFSTTGLTVCILLFLFSALSQSFHDFSVYKLEIHPLILTVAISLVSFVIAILGVLKTKNGKSAFINLSVIVITLLISAISISILLFGNFINNI